MLNERTQRRAHKIMTKFATKTADPNLRVLERDPVPAALRRFIWDIQSMVELAESEREILLIGRDLMARLIATDDWLPTAFAVPNPAGGQQFQIYRDGLERFSVVCTVLWGGAFVAISQPSIWEIAGVLRGAVTREQLDGFPTKHVQVGEFPSFAAERGGGALIRERECFAALQHAKRSDIRRDPRLWRRHRPDKPPIRGAGRKH